MSINWSIGHLITGGRDASRYDESVFGSARTERWRRRMERMDRPRDPLFERHPRWRRRSRGRTVRFQLYFTEALLRDKTKQTADSYTWSRSSRRACSDAVAWSAVVDRLRAMAGFVRSRSRGLDDVAELLESEIALAVLEPL